MAFSVIRSLKVFRAPLEISLAPPREIWLSAPEERFFIVDKKAKILVNNMSKNATPGHRPNKIFL
jgi:hypothetical protein